MALVNISSKHSQQTYRFIYKLIRDPTSLQGNDSLQTIRTPKGGITSGRLYLSRE